MRNKYAKLLNQLKLREVEEPKHRDDRVLLVDGLNTFIRAYSATPTLNANGEHCGGISGFLSSMGHAIKTIDPTRVVVVFDGKNGSATRRKLYPEYKAHRKVKIRLNRAQSVEKEDNQLEQLIRLVDYLETLPITVLTLDGAEADDVIAYITNEVLTPKNSHTFIMSSDKDFLQLVSNNVHIWSPTKKKLYYEDDVYSEFGIIPQNFAVYRALEGDNSDNIPGAPGLKLKTIVKRWPRIAEQKLISLEEFFTYNAELMDESKIKAYEAVEQNAQDIKLYHKIMQLHETLLNSTTQLRINNIMEDDVQKLAKMKFHKLLIEDGMGNAIKNPEMWIRDIATKLNHYQEML
jgi:5'-3' exonuclease